MAYFTGDDDDMTNADSPTDRLVYLSRDQEWLDNLDLGRFE